MKKQIGKIKKCRLRWMLPFLLPIPVAAYIFNKQKIKGVFKLWQKIKH